jgi:hypothetical protein
MNRRILHPDEVGKQFPSKLDRTYPIDGYQSYGLDTFSDVYPQLVKKGYLKDDFQSKFSPYTAVNEQKQKVNTAGFVDDNSALQAKAAMMAYTRDQLTDYTKKKNLTLSPEANDFFTLASYNSGMGNGQKMLDYFNENGLLKDNAFLKTKPKKYTGIYTNVMRRIQGANMLHGEGKMRNGGILEDGGDPEPDWKKKLFASLYPNSRPSNGTTGHVSVAPTPKQINQQKIEEQTKPKIIYKDRKNDDALRKISTITDPISKKSEYDTIKHLAYTQLLREVGSPDLELDPNIQKSFAGRSHFLPTPDNGKIVLDEENHLIPEAAHAYQMQHASPGGLPLRWLKDWVQHPYITSNGQKKLYNIPGTLEAEAHGYTDYVSSQKTGRIHTTDIDKVLALQKEGIPFAGEGVPGISDKLYNRFNFLRDSINEAALQGKTGWKTGNPFEDLKPIDKKMKAGGKMKGYKCEDGGALPIYYPEGSEHDLSPEEIKSLLAQGYELQYK